MHVPCGWVSELGEAGIKKNTGHEVFCWIGKRQIKFYRNKPSVWTVVWKLNKLYKYEFSNVQFAKTSDLPIFSMLPNSNY